MSERPMTLACDCGSGKPRRAAKDGYNIFLFYCCDDCYDRKIGKYRPDIMTEYECEEPIEPED